MSVSRRILLQAGAALAAASALTSDTAAAATGRPVIFVAPHPDDEMLGFGPQLRRHVVYGRDVHLLLLTDGEATRVRDELNGLRTNPWWKIPHNPAVEGYPLLDRSSIAAARLREFTAALGCMGIGPDRIHRAHLPDGGVTVAAAKTAILELAAGLPDTGLWTMTWLVDNHPDHLAAGQAVLQLGREQPTRFWDRRYVMLSNYLNDSRVAQLPHPPIVATAANDDERYRTINACRSYACWQPRSGAFAVGWHSVDNLFSSQQANPRAIVHRDQ